MSRQVKKLTRSDRTNTLDKIFNKFYIYLSMNYSNKKARPDTLRIAIIGVDGSGKSSCFKGVLKKISKRNLGGIGDGIFVFKKGKLLRPKVKHIKIKTFLGEKAKFVKNRILYKILKLTELILRVKIQDEIERKYRLGTILTDGAPLINTIGWGNFYHTDIFSETICRDVIGYLTRTKIPLSRKLFFLKNAPEILLVNLLGIKFQKPDIVFFLEIAPEIAISRVEKRDKKQQVHETKIFLNELQEAYQLVCKILKADTKIYSIDTSKKTLNQVIDTVIGKI